MSSDFRLAPGAVIRHADAVGDVSDQLRQARSAVHEVSMDSQAYGQLCQFLPSLLSPLFAGASDAMSDAVEAMEETALKLRATVDSMTATDLGSARELHRAGGTGIELPL